MNADQANEMLTVADKAGDALRNERSDFIRENP